MPRYQVVFSYSCEIEVDGDERDAEDKAGEMLAEMLTDGELDVRDFGAVVNEGWLGDEEPSDSEYGCPICQACLPDMHQWELHIDYCENVNGSSCEHCGEDTDEWSETLCKECHTEEKWNSGE